VNWRGRRVVVTGGAGFLGSHLCEALVASGADVTVLDDFSYGSPANLDAIKKDVRLLHGRLGDGWDGLEEPVDGEVLFHLAAVADPRKCKEDFDTAFRTNVLGVKTVLEAAKRFERVIVLSSAAVYGDPEYLPIDEKHPLKGKDPYAVTKVLAEWLCRHFSENAGVRLTAARNFNAFGPRQSTAYLIPTLVTQALAEKKIEMWSAEPVRDFLFVSDTVGALLAIAGSDATVGTTVNIGAGRGVRVGDLAVKIAALFNVPLVDLKRAVGGSVKLVCDNSLLKKLTGWAPKVSLDEGLARTVEWFQREHGW
jgi:dTDP-glucose 4,6-dehydratase